MVDRSIALAISLVLVAAGPALAHGRSDPAFTAHIFVGPGFGLGGRSLVQTRTQSTIKTVTTTGTNASTTTTTSSSVTSPGEAISNVTGTETMASLGAQYDLGHVVFGDLGLYGEIVARDYVFSGTPQALYGLRLGAGMTF